MRGNWIKSPIFLAFGLLLRERPPDDIELAEELGVDTATLRLALSIGLT